MRVILGVSPYSCCVEAKNLRDSQGISSLNVIVLIADHSHTVFAWGSGGITFENRHRSSLYVKYMGIKVMTQHFCLSM